MYGLSSVFFAMRTVAPLMKKDTFKVGYFAYCHPIQPYEVFSIENKIIRIMAGVKSRRFCRFFCLKVNILLAIICGR
jgi:hypothetical protein